MRVSVIPSIKRDNGNHLTIDHRRVVVAIRSGGSRIEVTLKEDIFLLSPITAPSILEFRGGKEHDK